MYIDIEVPVSDLCIGKYAIIPRHGLKNDARLVELDELKKIKLNIPQRSL